MKLLTKRNCSLCNGPVQRSYDFGTHPISNRFVRNPKEPESQYGLVLGICERCATLQIQTPIPYNEIVPAYDWVTYVEPEGHLDALTEVLIKFISSKTIPVVAGLTLKDTSVVDRFRSKIKGRFINIDSMSDLGVKNPRACIETLQNNFNPTTARQMVQKYGQIDLLIVRHILEHAQDVNSFLDAVKTVLADDGVAVFETPDSTEALQSLNYTMIWEEHQFYLTPLTFRFLLENHGFEMVWMKNYPYSVENSLVAVVRKNSGTATTDSKSLTADLELADRYLKNFPAMKKTVQKMFSEKKKEKEVAVFGAGHTSCYFINLMEVAQLVSFVVDDKKEKQGLLMPGSHLPIISSQAMADRGNVHCYFSVRPEIQQKIIAKNESWKQAGVTYDSIFNLKGAFIHG